MSDACYEENLPDLAILANIIGFAFENNICILFNGLVENIVISVVKDYSRIQYL